MARHSDPQGQRIVRSGKSRQASLNVPMAIASVVSETARFRPELTDEGILYRYVSGQDPAGVIPEYPDWVRRG